MTNHDASHTYAEFYSQSTLLNHIDKSHDGEERGVLTSLTERELVWYHRHLHGIVDPRKRVVVMGPPPILESV